MVFCIVTHATSVSLHVLPNSYSTISLAFSSEIALKLMKKNATFLGYDAF